MHTSSPPSRKRSRLRPVDQPVSVSPASKRRKLSGLADDAPTALSSFTRTIEGVLGLGEEATVDGEREIAESVLGDEGEDEEGLGGGADAHDGVRHEEHGVAEVAPSPTPKRGRGRPRKADSIRIVGTQVPESAVGDANDIDELASNVGITTEGIMPSPTPKRGRGRPKKSDSTPRVKVVKAPIEQAHEVLAGGNTETTPAVVKRGRGRPRKDSMPKPVTDMDDKIEDNGIDQLGENVGVRMSARRKSTRFDGDETPKGILTPSKRKDGIRKSVAFEIGDPGLGLRVGEDELGFKDLPVRQTKEHSSADDGTMDELNDDAFQVEKKSQKVLEVDEEEITCAICSGADSEEPNEILLCDSCDTAYHQMCYDIPVIPEDDWLCRDCQPEEDILDLVEEVPIEVDEIEVTTMVQNNMPEIEEFETHLKIMQRLLLQKLTGGTRLKLHGLDEEFRKVHQVVEQTVLAGEGNSMLVIGARGSGKTALVETVLSEISSEHRDDFHVVRLNGFVHTDDKLALREIWRQLGREMAVEDELTGKTNNYADTLASLLALLSHPSELDQSNGDHTAKSIIFILDEFDLFTAHPRQTLLYNLFDIAQARKAPIAVLGITTRIDVVESLEKRVKSRFSHRYVHLSLTRNLASFWEVCKEGLLIDEDGTDDDLMDHVASAGWYEFLAYWSTMVENLYADDSLFMDHLQSLFYRTKSVPDFFTSALIPISSLTPTNLPLSGAHFTSALNPPDSKLTLLPSLSDLELALLISAARLDIILDTDTCNFSMAYDEYCTLTSRHKIQSSSTGIVALGGNTKVWGRDVAVGAWEKLVETELLVPAAMGPTREGGREGKMWRVDVALEEIAGSVSSLTGVMAKWCREI